MNKHEKWIIRYSDLREETNMSDAIDQLVDEVIASVQSLSTPEVGEEKRLPSDEEIQAECNKRYPQYSSQAKKSGWKHGAKWMRDKTIKALSGEKR
jgi:hypothetical protein